LNIFLQRPVALSLFVKPDYHDLGLKEQLTASERCKFWLHSWLRGSSRVLVARFDPRASVIAEWEYHSLKTLIYGKSGEGQAQHADFFEYVWLIVPAECGEVIDHLQLPE